MKKLKEVEELVQQVDGRIEKLRRFGFKKVYTGSASGFIMIHHGRRVVVKRPCIVHRRIMHDKKDSVFRIPTIRVKRAGRLGQYGWILIQPKARRTRLDLAFIRILDAGYDRTDHKRDNCGWYRGKPVLIDW